MSSLADANDMKCAACGKGGDDLKACTACKLVKYCNASCQGGHWSKHKKECKKRAAELKDEALFKQPPPREECDICMLTLPIAVEERKYQPCCGKVLCYGCIRAAYMADNRRLCPFCRTPEATSQGETLERIQKRAEIDDAEAIYSLGCLYKRGDMGLPQDYDRAMELWLRSGELGHAMSYSKIGTAYYNGQGAERDVKKAIHYYELAAMVGDECARHNLGCMEKDAGNNMSRATKHWMIAAGAGYDNSLTNIRACFMDGYATKEDFEKALRSHKEAKDEMRSDQREAATAATSPDGILRM